MNIRRFFFSALLVIALVAAAIVAVPTFKRRREQVQCGNQMHVVLYVATLEWPMDHDDQLPTNFVSMSQELIMPQLLICPGDRSRHAVANWATFTDDHSSYEIVTPGLTQADTNRVFLRCKIHSYTGYADDRLLDAKGKLIRPNRTW